jgi:DNA-binding SARP family transcriptional activator
MLRVCVLGELQLELDGHPLALPSRRPARVLLAWLALHPGMHARSTVAGRLWPNVLDESARVSLRSALAALRVAIGPTANEALPATRSEIGLGGRPDVWVDLHEFDRLLSGRHAEAALELCRRELLAGLDEDWVLAARDAHRAREGEALGMLASASVAAGDHDSAIALARRRAGLDPFDESAHRELISVLAQAGDRGGALVAYQRLANRLGRELGVAPSGATRALAAGLRNQTDMPQQRRLPPAPSRHAEPPPLPARIAAAARSGPLLGRESELASLRELWARSGTEPRRLALVTGEPGIGKTRLVAEFAAELDPDRATVLYGVARAQALVPYEPFVDCLREVLWQLDELPLEATELAGLIPELAGRLDAQGKEPPRGTPSPSSRLRLFDAFATSLDAIAGGRPPLLILEDLHWAEAATIRLLVDLAGRTDGSPQMLIVTYRDTEIGARHPLTVGLAELHRALPVKLVSLHGIDTPAVAAMLGRAAVGGPALGSPRTLRDRTGGNPFFIEQLVKGEAVLGEQPGAGRPPAGVEHVIALRVAALGSGARAILGAGAVSGSEFELSLLTEVLELPVDAVLDVLDAAEGARLVAGEPGAPGRYAFVHAIVRETLAGALTAARRAHIHDLFAGILERRAETDPDRYLAAAANHALEAAAGHGDPERAVALAEQVARRAGAVLAYEDAAELLRRAAAVLERHQGPAGRRAELMCALGEALARAGSTDADATLRQADELAWAADRSDLIARVALAKGGTGVTILGADSNLVYELDRALDAVGQTHPALRARLLARLAIELAYEPDAGRRESVSAEALKIAGRLDDPAALGAALNARHVALWGPDHTEQRKELADEMLELAERASDRELALQARNWRIVDLLELGDGQAVRDELDAYAALAARARLPAYSWYLPMWRATLALIEGRIGEGVALSRRARDLGRRAGDRNADVFFAEQQLLRHCVEGRLRDLDPPAAGSEGLVAERSQRGPAWRAYHFTFAWVHAERGEIDQARREFEAALTDGFDILPRDVNWLDALGAAANAAVVLGDLERCHELRTLLTPYAERMIVNARGALHAGSVAYVLARLAAVCADNAAADELYQHASERDQHAGASAWVLRDLHHHSNLLGTIGQHKRANLLARRAAQLADAIASAGSRAR